MIRYQLPFDALTWERNDEPQSPAPPARVTVNIADGDQFGWHHVADYLRRLASQIDQESAE